MIRLSNADARRLQTVDLRATTIPPRTQPIQESHPTTLSAVDPFWLDFPSLTKSAAYGGLKPSQARPPRPPAAYRRGKNESCVIA
jgi:hypothetical protein